MNKTTLIFGISLMFSQTPCQAEITTDGSVGPAQDLAGPNFSIGQNLGTLSGNKLFHSFSHFNLSNGQSATFTGDAAIQNVISRVTSGEVSSIDGKLISTIGNAGFYFINPAGIVFGQNAKVDVPGAFHASTANELQFADGGKFSANPLAGSSLSMAAPAAFGFLAHTAANNGLLRVEGATLEVKPGQALDLVAGKIEANNATLGAAQTTVDKADTETLGREIRLVAMQGAGTVGLDRAGGVLPLPETTPSATNAGDITLKDTSLIASGNGGGRIGIWGRDVTASVRDTSVGINAVNTGSTHAASQHGIEIKTDNLTLDGITIRAHAQESGNAGDIRVQSAQDTTLRQGGRVISAALVNSAGNTGNISISAGRDLIVDGLNTPDGFDTEISTRAVTNSEGKAGGKGNVGDVSINAGRDVSLSNGSEISSFVQQSTTGNSGNVNVRSGRDINIGSDSLIYSIALKNSAGQVGDVYLQAQRNLQLDKGGEISSSSLTNAKAGTLSVRANGNVNVGGYIAHEVGEGDQNANSGSLHVKAGGDLAITSSGIIDSRTSGDRSAANIAVNVGGKLTIEGNIQSSNEGDKENLKVGNAGNIDVHADGDIFLDGNGSTSGYGKILSIARFSNGNAGNIDVSTNGKLTLVNMASINAKTHSDIGHAGDIKVQAQGDILLDQGAQISSATLSKADAGNVSVVSSNNLTNNSSAIVASSSGAGNGGNVFVDVKGNVNLLNGGQISSSPISLAQLQKTASGNGGNVFVRAQGNVQINGRGSAISAATYGTGNAGNTSVITSGNLSILNSGVLGSFSNASGDAGNVDVYANNILLENGAVASGAYKDGSGQAGNIHISFAHWLTANNNSFINTTSVNGNGGAITINGGELLRLHNSSIETTVTGGQGNGGNITVNADILLMDTGLIQANANSGNGGDINLNLKALIPSGDSLTVGGVKVAWDYLTPNFNVIQAVSETGVSGVPNITAPQLNIVGALVGLNNPELDLSRIGHDPCSETVRQSTLKRSGKGGVPMLNKGLDSYTLEHLLETKPDVAAGIQQAAHTPNAQQDCKPKPVDKPLQTLTY